MTKSIDLWKNLSPSPKKHICRVATISWLQHQIFTSLAFSRLSQESPFYGVTTQNAFVRFTSNFQDYFNTFDEKYSRNNVHCTVSVVVWVRVVVSFKHLRRHFDWFPSELCFYCGGVNGPRLPIQFVTPVHLTERSASGINKPWTWPKHSDIACLQTLTWQFFWYSNLPTKEQKESLQ